MFITHECLVRMEPPIPSSSSSLPATALALLLLTGDIFALPNLASLSLLKQQQRLTSALRQAGRSAKGIARSFRHRRHRP